MARLKSLPFTIKNKQALNFRDYYKINIWFWLRYLLILALASYLFYRRFPNNYQHPNFYAEDGQVFARNIINNGFLKAIGTTFNGYYIWGLYILEKIGMVINFIFFHNEFANLARSFAIVSYMFLGFITTLPILLFKNYFRLMAISLIVLLGLFVAMPNYDYAIIGTIGNLKFAFIYLAFLLLVYRHLMPEGSKMVYLVDFGLLICANTNITVYPMILFSLLRYIPKLKGKEFYKRLFSDRSFQSLLVLGVILLPQLYIVKAHGVPVLKGYLDSGYIQNRTIEIFLSRSYLFGFLSPINKSLNNVVVIILMAALIGFGWFYAGRYRKIFIFGIISVFLASLLFVVKRTGVSSLFSGYKDGGPDQFFYPQNWIFGFVVSLVVVEIVNKLKLVSLRILIYGSIFGFIIFGLAPKASSYGSNDSMNQNVGTIYAVGQKDCNSKQSFFNLTIYPTTNIHYDGVSRKKLCTNSVVNYRPNVVGFGLLPDNNHYIQISEVNIFQTFISPINNLSGISVYFSTFTHTIHTPYNLILYRANCSVKLAETSIPINNLNDNAFYTVRIASIAHSANVKYCFSIKPEGSNPDPLALQLSKPDIYLQGDTINNNHITNRDIVFSLYYN